MNRCPETDTVLSIGIALEWDDVVERLQHLAGCPRCQERLTQLAMVHETLQARGQPRPGFTAAVVEAVATVSHPSEHRAPRLRATELLSPILATLTALFTVGLTAEAWSIQPGPGVIVAVLLVGSATFGWNRTRARRHPQSA